jgi:hypothetical protein
MEKNDRGRWLIMYSGVKFYYLSPLEEEILIIDIAHHLARINRFNGCIDFSVAAHSLLLSDMAVETGYFNPWDALMHDCAEAYIGDIVSPLKQILPLFKEIENLIMCVAAKKFGFNFPMDKALKHYDRALGCHEAVESGIDITDWTDTPAFPENTIAYLKRRFHHYSIISPTQIEKAFLRRFGNG